MAENELRPMRVFSLRFQKLRVLRAFVVNNVSSG